MLTPTSQISSAGFTSKLPGQMARVRNATLLVLAILLLALPGMTLADSPLQDNAPGQVAAPITYAVVKIKPRQGANPNSREAYCRINSNDKFVVKLENIGDAPAPQQRVGVIFELIGGRQTSLKEKYSVPIPAGETRRVVFALPPNSEQPNDMHVYIYLSGRYAVTALCL